MRVLERIAATIPSRKVTVILLCEGEATYPTMYGSIDKNANITILSANTTPQTISNILTHAFDETKTTRH